MKGCSSGRAGNNRVMCGGEPRGAERPPRIEQVQSHWGPRYEALHLADMGSLAQVSWGQCQLTLWRHRPTLTALQSYVALHCSTADFDTIRISRVLGLVFTFECTLLTRVACCFHLFISWLSTLYFLSFLITFKKLIFTFISCLFNIEFVFLLYLVKMCPYCQNYSFSCCYTRLSVSYRLKR